MVGAGEVGGVQHVPACLSKGDSCTVLQQQSVLKVGPGRIVIIGERPRKHPFPDQPDLLYPEMLKLLSFGNHCPSSLKALSGGPSLC